MMELKARRYYGSYLDYFLHSSGHSVSNSPAEGRYSFRYAWHAGSKGQLFGKTHMSLVSCARREDVFGSCRNTSMNGGFSSTLEPVPFSKPDFQGVEEKVKCLWRAEGMAVIDLLAKWDCLLLLSPNIAVAIVMDTVNTGVAIPSGLSLCSFLRA